MGKSDIILKNCLSDNERFADCYNIAVQEHLLDADKLHAMDSVLDGVFPKNKNANESWQEQKICTYSKIRDVIRGYGESPDAICAITCIENQQDIYYGEVAQMMIYDAYQYNKQLIDIRRMYEKKLKTGKEGWLRGFGPDDRLLPVSTICVYYGDEPWNAAMELHDIIDFSGFPERKRKVWKGLVQNYHLKVLDIKRMDDKEIDQMSSDLRLLFGCLKYSGDRKMFQAFLEQNWDEFSCIRSDLSIAMDVMLNMNEKNVMRNMQEEFTGQEVVDMCKAWEDWLADERAEGKLEMQRDNILELLKELGDVSDSVRDSIMQERDMKKLAQWFKLASKADSLEIFEKEMENVFLENV